MWYKKALNILFDKFLLHSSYTHSYLTSQLQPKRKTDLFTFELYSLRSALNGDSNYLYMLLISLTGLVYIYSIKSDVGLFFLKHWSTQISYYILVQRIAYQKRSFKCISKLR